jgi:hypothetical protein
MNAPLWDGDPYAGPTHIGADRQFTDDEEFLLGGVSDPRFGQGRTAPSGKSHDALWSVIFVLAVFALSTVIVLGLYALGVH